MVSSHQHHEKRRIVWFEGHLPQGDFQINIQRRVFIGMLIRCILCYNHLKTSDSVRGYRWIAGWMGGSVDVPVPSNSQDKAVFKALDFDGYEWLLICPHFLHQANLFSVLRHFRRLTCCLSRSAPTALGLRERFCWYVKVLACKKKCFKSICGSEGSCI